MNIQQMLPANIEAEECVLGSILIDPTGLARVLKRIKPCDFYMVKNRMIFESMLEMRAFSRPIDFVTMVSALEDRGHLNEVGGPAYISHLLNAVPLANRMHSLISHHG